MISTELILMAFSAILFILAIVAGICLLCIRKNKTTISENICPQCGKPVTNGKKFCTNCGAKIK